MEPSTCKCLFCGKMSKFLAYFEIFNRKKSNLEHSLYFIIDYVPAYTKRPITLVNKDFGPRGKMSVSYVFLDVEFEYVSIISLSPTPFALHQTM